MDKQNLLCSHLIEKAKMLIKNVIGKDSGPQFKFYLDMVYGILKTKSVVLNEIAYSLNEETSLKKTNERLYKNLMKEQDVTERHKLIALALKYMREKEKVFIVDDSDVIKPYGKAFESLGLVRDGSCKDKNKNEKGFHVTTITGLSKTKKQPMIMYDWIHSSKEKNYLSANNITNIGVQIICEHLKPFEGMFVFDRGYDDSKLMTLIHSKMQYFLIRMKIDRWLIGSKSRIKAFEKAKLNKGKVVIPITMYSEEREIKASVIKCKINGFKDYVYVVFSYLNENDEPMILMTNYPIKDKNDLIKIVYRYSSRWRIEELFRFKKSELDFENFRVKSLASINNLNFILDLCIFYLSMIIEEDSKYLYGELLKCSKKIKSDVSVEFYRILSSVNAIFGTNKKGVKKYKKIDRREPKQLDMFKIFDFNK